ncbi:MAG: hypothetical protein N3B11_02650 [Coriobacteriia bacterium]|nr:hypothetical protein [Coriobacteriia bacterium]
MGIFDHLGNMPHLWAAAETEVLHPTRPKEPPPRAGRTQLVGLAVFLTAPVLIWLLLDWLAAR